MPLPRPADPAIVEPLRPAHPAFGLEFERIGEGRRYEQFRWTAQTYSEGAQSFKTLEGEYFRVKIPLGGVRGPVTPAPLIIVAPILGGEETEYLACRIFSRYACERGFSAFFLYQGRSILSSSRDGIGLEALLREGNRDAMKALDLFAALPEVDDERLGSLGISLGAIRNVLLIATDPRLRANLLCIGGADLPEILRTSNEPGVLGYFRRRRRREGISRERACVEIERALQSDPARVAESIDPRRVTMILARFDDKVPIANGRLLWEMLGRPETYVLPAGHYTALLLSPFAARVGFDALVEKVSRENS